MGLCPMGLCRSHWLPLLPRAALLLLVAQASNGLVSNNRSTASSVLLLQR